MNLTTKFTKYKNYFFIILVLVVFYIINNYIKTNEEILKSEKFCILEIESKNIWNFLKQDYIELNYKLLDNIYFNKNSNKNFNKNSNKNSNNIKFINKHSIVLTKTNNKGLARFKKIYQGETLKKNEIILNIKIKNNKIYIGNNKFYYLEGESYKYSFAKFAYLNINKNGDAILIKLLDKNFNKIY